MASWVTHLMIADRLLEAFPALDPRGFCVGSIAPDCNVENADFTAFEPPREKTHWMAAPGQKRLEDAERFWSEYVLPGRWDAAAAEERAFLLGYYAHLVADAAYQVLVHDPAHVEAIRARMLADAALGPRARELPADWTALKRLLPKAARTRELNAIDAETLAAHPRSGYLIWIVPLRSFPDYLDFLPPGAIARKVRVMGGVPKRDPEVKYIGMLPEEVWEYAARSAARLEGLLREKMDGARGPAGR